MMETTVIYQCPNCGAGLSFDAEAQKFSCEFCLSEFTEDQLCTEESEAERQRMEEERQEFNASMDEYSCPSCGARVVADHSTAAHFCYYCHNPVVLVGRLSGQLRPQKVVPFKFDKEHAKERFLKFAKRKWFVPRSFFSASQVEKITGVYYPFWITDADTESSMRADATRQRVWRVGNTEYTETSKFEIERSGNIHFEDITTSAFSEADKHMLEGVLPYPSEALEEFSMPYLSGFVAKKRDLERDALNAEVKKRMNGYAGTLLQNTAHGYNTVNIREMNVNIKQSHWEYALLPIWILTYRGRDNKVYTYALNGHTGQVYGELPISFFKLGLLFAAIVAAATPIIALLGGMLF